MYKKMLDPITGQVSQRFIRFVAEGIDMGIPCDASLPEYQAYLKWVAEGNTPEPADEPSA
jgi:hypothetical protein